jgi:hypothetical protein
MKNFIAWAWRSRSPAPRSPVCFPCRTRERSRFTSPARSARPAPSRRTGIVAFHTTGTGKLKNPRVWVACYQNGALVYGEGGGPSTVFKLGGDSSQWVANGGGAATCTADLYYILNANGTGEWNGKVRRRATSTLPTHLLQRRASRETRGARLPGPLAADLVVASTGARPSRRCWRSTSQSCCRPTCQA